MDPTYYYTARDVRGAAVRGSIQASTASAALANLRMRSLFVTSLENAQSVRGTLASLLQIGGVSRNALVTFFRCFATLVRAGVPMRRSLDVGIDQCADALHLM
jgi:type II secretory pathway component PulF